MKRRRLLLPLALRLALLFALSFLLGMIVVFWSAGVDAGAAQVSAVAPTTTSAGPTTRVAIRPRRVAVLALSIRYRLQIERAAAAEFGLDAPVAVLAAQLHQESRFDPDARSPYAVGLAQFTPATAQWLPAICPHLGEFDPWDADQSVRAQACYDAWLHRQVGAAASACDRLAFMLADYNGGQGWRRRDQSLATKAGLDPTRWFSQVEGMRSRGVSAHAENRQYVRRILHVLTPAYSRDGWPGGVTCT